MHTCMDVKLSHIMSTRLWRISVSNLQDKCLYAIAFTHGAIKLAVEQLCTDEQPGAQCSSSGVERGLASVGLLHSELPPGCGEESD